MIVCVIGAFNISVNLWEFSADFLISLARAEAALRSCRFSINSYIQLHSLKHPTVTVKFSILYTSKCKQRRYVFQTINRRDVYIKKENTGGKTRIKICLNFDDKMTCSTYDLYRNNVNESYLQFYQPEIMTIYGCRAKNVLKLRRRNPNEPTICCAARRTTHINKNKHCCWRHNMTVFVCAVADCKSSSWKRKQKYPYMKGVKGWAPFPKKRSCRTGQCILIF